MSKSFDKLLEECFQLFYEKYENVDLIWQVVGDPRPHGASIKNRNFILNDIPRNIPGQAIRKQVINAKPSRFDTYET